MGRGGTRGLASKAVSPTRAEQAELVAELRRARRRQRVAAIHWVDAMYQVYITGVVAIIALLTLSSVIGDEKVEPGTVADVIRHGPAVLGALAAIAIFTGLRSGSRGGPIALEAPDVRHVLLAPIDRGVALQGPALRQLRFLTFVGLAVGAGVGQLALRRLPGNGLAWMAWSALFGAVVLWIYFGSALMASGLRVPRWLATVVGGLLVVWSVLDVLESVDGLPAAPTTTIGQLPLWPLETNLWGLVGPVLALLLVGVGLAVASGVSLEAAERRTNLVGQLRFAVTLQDLRTVLVLRRQLAQERPKSRPWIPALRKGPVRFPVFRRGVRSVMRWPLSRILRVVALAVVAGFALRGVWTGTTPLLAVAGIALWIAALDAAEPLGQEVDHPGRTDGFPIERSRLHLAHLPLIGIVSVLTGLIAAAVAAVPVGDSVPVGVAVVTAVAAGLLAGAGAVVSVIQGAPDAVDVLSMSAPEIAGSRTVVRTAWPPVLAIVGTLPMLAGRAAEQGVSDPPPAAAAGQALGGILVLVVLFVGWVRFRDDIHAAIRQAAEDMSPTKAVERMAEERRAEEEREQEALADSRRIAGVDRVDEPDDERTRKPKASRQPRPAPKPKPKPEAAQPGVQGGTSAKPIGRARDRRKDQS